MKKIYFITFLAFLLNLQSYGQLSGTYTISQQSSQNPDYTSIQSAITSAATQGVQGIVTFNVMPGTYNEFIEFPDALQLNQNNQLVFKGMAPDNQQVIISGDANYAQKPIIKFNTNKFITIKNIKLVSTSTNYSNVVVFFGNVKSITFDSVYFKGQEISAASYNNDKHLVYDKHSAIPDSALHFKNCTFQDGYIGMYMQGNNTLNPMDDGLLVENCKFNNQYSKSIYSTFQINVSIKNNLITNNKDIKSGFQAIDMYWVKSPSIIEGNNIKIDFSNKNATGIELRPAVGTTENPVVVKNNMVNITSEANLNYPFALSHSSAQNVSIVHNTVLMQGNGNGSMFFVESVIPNLTIQNNIIVNNGLGYIFRFTKADISGLNSNYNKILFNGDFFGRITTTNHATLSDWTTATSNDNNSSIISTSPFISNTNLHISSSDGLTVANPLLYVTHDIDNDLRSTVAPCAGADEIVSTANMPPYVNNPIQNITFSNNNDSTIISLANTFSDPDDPDEDIIISILSNTNPTLVEAQLLPNNREIKVKRLSSTVGNATIALNANSNGQSVQTSFIVFCNEEPVAPTIVNQVAPVEFTTFPETIKIPLNNAFEIPNNPTALYTLSIESYDNTNFDAFISNDTLIIVRTSTVSFFNNEIVIRCSYNTLHTDMTILVSGTEVTISHGIATFEDVVLNNDSIWVPNQIGDNFMISNSWKFYSYYQTSWWGGFVASNRKDISQSGMNAQYTAITGIGYDSSSNYGVSYAMGYPNNVYPIDNIASSITGCYVTNNLWTYEAILEGDGFSSQFGGTSGNEPDYYRMWAVGTKENNTYTDTLYFYLADYRFSNNSEDYVVNTWEWFDLSELGVVKTVRFGVQSTKTNQWGMTTPAYFCIDDFNGVAPTPANLPPYVANPIYPVIFDSFPDSTEILLNLVFADPDDPIEDIVITVENNSNPSLVSTNIIDQILYLQRLSDQTDTLTITLKAISNGDSILTAFNVNCLPTDTIVIDLPPVLTNPISTIMASGFPWDSTFSLAGIVTDPDNNDSLIVYTLINNSNIQILNANITDNSLFLEKLSDVNDSVKLTIRATSNGLYIDFEITVKLIIDYNNIAPEINEISIYPNPCKDFINIKSNNRINSYIIIDNKGVVQQRGKISDNKIILRDLIRGNYVLILIDNNSIIGTESFIKI